MGTHGTTGSNGRRSSARRGATGCRTTPTHGSKGGRARRENERTSERGRIAGCFCELLAFFCARAARGKSFSEPFAIANGRLFPFVTRCRFGVVPRRLGFGDGGRGEVPRAASGKPATPVRQPPSGEQRELHGRAKHNAERGHLAVHAV